MSIFPFTDPQEIAVNTEREIPMAREYAYDFYKGDFKLKNGKMYLVEGKEALKVWITKSLLTSRYKEVIFTWNYGGEFEDKIIGQGYTKGLIKAEAERYTRECINASLRDYITGMKDFDIEFLDGTLKIGFIAETIYGEVSVDV